MILADSAILEEMKKGNIVFNPFTEKNLGSNSYDVSLSKHLKCYKNTMLDSRADNPTLDLTIPTTGFMLYPGRLYLGTTVEYTETKGLVPYLEGKSSIGRLGIKVHVTAGKGDVGFKGHWTLELEVTQPVRVYAGMKIAQVTFYKIQGECLRPYDLKDDAKYNNNSIKPMPSLNYRNRFEDSGVAGIQDED